MKQLRSLFAILPFAGFMHRCLAILIEKIARIHMAVYNIMHISHYPVL